MEDDIFTIRTDIQHCIANNMKLDTEYRLLLFENNTMRFTKSLGCFENLEIEPSNTRMKFKGEIAKDLLFNKEDMVKIKKNSWRENLVETIRQIAESKKTEIQKQNEKNIGEMLLAKALEENEDIECEYRKPTRQDKLHIKATQILLEEKCSLKLDYEEHEECLLLIGNFEHLKFNRYQLRRLQSLVEPFDMFIIAPFYDEEDDKCKSIRIVLGLDLREK